MSKLTFSYFNTSTGFWLTTFIIPLIILDLSKSAFYVTLSYALNIIPYIIITPLAGVLGDTLNRKKIILFGEFFSALTGFLIYLTPFNASNIHIFIILGFIISSFAAIHHPVFQSIIPDTTQPELVKNENARIGIVDSIVGIIAPAIIGVALISFDKKSVSLLIPIFYIMSFFSFSTVHYTPIHTLKLLSIKGTIESLKEGIAYVINKTELRNIAILFFIVNFGIRLVLPNLMWIFNTTFGIPDNKIAPYFIIIGLLSVIGAKTAVHFIGKTKDINIILISTFWVGICSLALCFTQNALSLSIVWGISSLMQSIIIVTFFTYRQTITEPYILSRVVSVTRLISYLAIPLSSISGGLLLEKQKNIDTIFIASGFFIFLSLAIYFFMAKKFR